MTEKETAYHEAGHAVVHFLLGIENEHISIVQDENSAGRVIAKPTAIDNFVPDAYLNYDGFMYIENQVLSYLAGLAAERTINNKAEFDTSRSDYHEAINLLDYLRLLIYQWFG